MTTVELESTITCPGCGHSRTMTMEEFDPRTVWPCPACGSTLRPLPGEHCIYCSYASLPCPPVQRAALAEQQIDLDEEES